MVIVCLDLSDWGSGVRVFQYVGGVALRMNFSPGKTIPNAAALLLVCSVAHLLLDAKV